jgi:hypothetical protein
METTVSSAAGFWSYTHKDDEAEQGRIRRFAAELSAEYSLLTGDDIEIFVDRNIQWGEQWRARIESALANATFFLPIITPRFFKSVECRRELLTFHSQSTSLGVKEYLLPIYYVSVPDLDENNSDEAIAVVARTQYFPWTDLRLAAPESAEYRQGINALATRLVGIAEQLAVRTAVTPSGERDTDEPRTLDLLQQVNQIWPTLIETIEKDRENEVMWAAIWTAHADRVKRLERAGRAGSRGALILKLAADSLPLAQSHLDLAKRYSALTIEIDPLIVELFRLARDGAEGVSDLLADLRSDISDTCDRIAAAGPRDSRLINYAAATKEMARVERLFDASGRYVSEGNRLVASWYDLAFGNAYPGLSEDSYGLAMP